MPLCPQITNTPITVVQNSDFTVSSVVPAVASTYDGLAQEIDSIVVDIDGKTKAYYQATAPTGASEGDIWFDTDEGNKQYFYNGTAWVSVQDAAIAAAQATADGKNRIYRQATQPTGGTYVEGDLWFDTDDDNRIYRFTSGSWATAVELGNNAISSLSANKLTAGTIDANVITVSNINAGNISTGTLNADRIASASITGAKIAASTITTDKLIAGTLTGYTINNGSGTFSVSSTGVVTASSGTIGGFTLATDRLGDLAGTYIGTNGNMGITVVNVRQSSGSTGVSMTNGANIGMNGGNIVMGNGNLTGATNISLNGTFTINSGGSMVSAGSVTISSPSTLTVGGTATFSGTSQHNAQVYMPNISSTTNAANMRWGTGGAGQIFYSTASSQRFKEDIVNLTAVTELDPKSLLALPVRAFRYKADYLDQTDDRSEVLIPGFIAEEVDSIYPVAADYDENGPVSWNDRLLIPGLLALIQDLYKEIAILKGE